MFLVMVVVSLELGRVVATSTQRARAVLPEERNESRRLADFGGREGGSLAGRWPGAGPPMTAHARGEETLQQRAGWSDTWT